MRVKLMSTAKTATKARWRKAQDWAGVHRPTGGHLRLRRGNFASRIRVDAIEDPGKSKRKIAVISVAGARSDFFNPVFALVEQLTDIADPSKQPSPVRHLDSASVTSTALVDAKRVHRYSRLLACRRMRKICGRWLRSWDAPFEKLPYSRFFMFSDCVRLQQWSHARGWTITRVPEDGLALSTGSA